MQFLQSLQQLMQHFSPTTVQLIISVLLLMLYYIISRRLVPLLSQVIAHSRLKAELNKRALVVSHILLVLLLVVVLSVVWGVDIRGLLVLASSMIAVIGVALFAAWSLLSNITAFFILLGQKAFAEGMEIKVVDGGNFVEGRIVEINLFSTVLRTKDNEQVVYPNNLLVSRPVVVLPKPQRSKTAGSKVVEKAERWRRKVLTGHKNN
ncbi:MAG: mechanosensitive ion channel [Rheinheimera sp.]|nr:mechanosensitive ion channel [Rheinheimera sp.]